MGIPFEVVRCEWPDGKPKQGHLQEAARNMRYQKFQEVCVRNCISVLMVAHHADDQICEGGGLEWVEDPTNQSQLYARNRIRRSLGQSSSVFDLELQAIVQACRDTRLYVDGICQNLINKAVTVVPYGYVVIDLELLSPSEVAEICLSNFFASVAQFVSQRHRPVRGSTSKLLLDYIRTIPCKTSLTAAGCYLCVAPGSKGTKMLVCCSVNYPLPSKVELICERLDDNTE